MIAVMGKGGEVIGILGWRAMVIDILGWGGGLIAMMRGGGGMIQRRWGEGTEITILGIVSIRLVSINSNFINSDLHHQLLFLKGSENWVQVSIS